MADDVRDIRLIDGRLPERIEAILKPARVPGAAMAIVKGGDRFVHSYGIKQAGGAAAVTPETAFDVGSCAKSYVATAIAILAGRGKLSLDDPVRAYVPEFELDDPWVTANIAIRDLLSNRTGLVRQRPIEAFPEPRLSLLDIIARVKKLRRVHPFRAGYVYFNLGFMTCALVVERVSGLSYAEFLERELFAPLGMTHSQSGSRAYERLPDRAAGHTASTGTVMALEDPVFDAVQGAGCLHSSASDATQWLRFQLGLHENGSIAPRARICELHRPHTVMPAEETGLMHRAPEAIQCSYCLGWWMSDFHGRRLVQHAGGMFGWRAQTALLPDSGLGVAVYLNIAANVHHAVAYMILETLLGIEPRDWGAVARAHAENVAKETSALMAKALPAERGAAMSLPLAGYAGTYTHPAAGDIEIVVDGDGLLMKQLDGRLWDLALTPFGADVFEATFAKPAVRDYLPVPARTRFVVRGGKAVAFEEPGTRYERRS